MNLINYCFAITTTASNIYLCKPSEFLTLMSKTITHEKDLFLMLICMCEMICRLHKQ